MRIAGHGPLPLDIARFDAVADEIDRRLLRLAVGPVLDIGCGPGRLLAALGERGVPSLGVEPSASAASLARRRGGAVLERSVFDRLPAVGRWRTVLLIDGNVGIGGDPVVLLQRVVELLHGAGAVLVELDPAAVGVEALSARIERDDLASPWFPWARVGVEAIDELAAAAKLVAVERWCDGGRWFAKLARRAR